MKTLVLFGLAILSGLILSGCTAKTAPVEKPVPVSSTEESRPSSKEAWQTEWDKVVKAGQREGIVVAHTGYSAETLRAISSAFRQKFGIETEFISGRGAELRARFFNERRAGIYNIDLLFRGASGMIADQKPVNALDPLEPLLLLPEVVDPKVWWGGKLNWIDDEHYIFGYFAYPSGELAINTSFVSSEELKSWKDLLAPKWKGKISLNDPTTSGSGNSWFYIMAKEIVGMDYMRQLAKQEPVILRDLRLQAEWIAAGKYPVAIAHGSAVIPEFVRAGVPIVEKVLAEGAYITAGFGAISLVNKAPHPNASRVFVNWVLSRDGQTLISRVQGNQSARLDVPTDHLPPIAIRQEGVKYADSRSEKAQLEQIQSIDAAREVFGFLLR